MKSTRKTEFGGDQGDTLNKMTELMVPVADITPNKVDYAPEMIALSTLAKEFLLSFSWCKEVIKGYLAWGFPKLGVFLFNVASDEGIIWTWVIVGSTPPAYIDFELCPNAYEALEGYIGEYKAWVECASKFESVDKLMPVYDQKSFRKLPPSPQLALDLDKRLEFIRQMILCEYEEDLRANRYAKD